MTLKTLFSQDKRIKTMLIVNLVRLSVLLLTLQGVFSNLCESNEYSSPWSNYHKLLGGAKNYDFFASKCPGDHSIHISEM